MGIFYGVSVGSGDPELITIKALRIIEKCPVIVAPRTKNDSLALSVAEKITDISGKKIIYADFPMTRDENILNNNYSRITDIICRQLTHNDVAMLNLGDISVYSTFSYIGDMVEKNGFEVIRCAGVTSFCACACECGISLADRDKPIIIVPFGCENIRDLLNSYGTKIIMKCGKNADELIKILKEMNLLGNTYAIENCGLDNQKILKGYDIAGSFGYFTVFIVL